VQRAGDLGRGLPLVRSTEEIAGTYSDAELAVIHDFLARWRTAIATHGKALSREATTARPSEARPGPARPGPAPGTGAPGTGALGIGGAGNRRRRGNVEQAPNQNVKHERGVHVRRLLLAAIPLLLLPGCATGGPPGDAPAPTTGAHQRRYQTTATVLESPRHGPELCLGVVMTSVPPQCDGVPVANWRWDRVAGEQTANGTTWGVYHLVGTYGGASFTVIRADQPPPATSRPSAEERFKDEPKSPCPEPEGGWKVPDPARRSEQYLEPVSRVARAQPDFAGLWLSYLEPMGHDVAEHPGEFVLNVAFTGALARHEAELRPRWGGRLCVTRQQRSYRALVRIQRELQGAAGTDLGLQVLSTGIDESANAVDLRTVVLDERTRAAVDARYGAGAVLATAALTPVT